MTVTDADSKILSEITINAPAAKIFDALTDPNQLPAWWGEEGLYKVTMMSADVRVGGAWKTEGVGSAGNTFTVFGTYRVVDPPHMLEYTWNYDWNSGPDQPETVVTFHLIERGDVTHVRVTHSGFTDTQARDNHGEGWKRVLGWLRAYAER